MNKNFQWIRDYYARGDYGSALRVLVFRAPNWSWDLLFGNYDEEGFDRYGYWSFSPKHPMFWRTLWREPFHFLGGVLATLPFLASPKISWIITLLIINLIFFNEFVVDAKRHPDLKNIIDWIFWSTGSASISVLSLILFGPASLK